MDHAVDPLLTQIRTYAHGRGWREVESMCDELVTGTSTTLLIATAVSLDARPLKHWLCAHITPPPAVQTIALAELATDPRAAIAAGFVVAVFDTTVPTSAEVHALTQVVLDRPAGSRALVLVDSQVPLDAADSHVARHYAQSLYAPDAPDTADADAVFLWSELSAPSSAAEQDFTALFAPHGPLAASRPRLKVLGVNHVLDLVIAAANRTDAPAASLLATEPPRDLDALRQRLTTRARTLVDELEAALIADLAAQRAEMRDRWPQRIATSPMPTAPRAVQGEWLLESLRKLLQTHADAHFQSASQAIATTANAWSHAVQAWLADCEWSAPDPTAAPKDSAAAAGRLVSVFQQHSAALLRTLQTVDRADDWVPSTPRASPLVATTVGVFAGAALGSLVGIPLGALVGGVSGTVAGPVGVLLGGAAGAFGVYNLQEKSRNDALTASARAYGAAVIEALAANLEVEIRAGITALRASLVTASRDEVHQLAPSPAPTPVQFGPAADRVSVHADDRRAIAGWQRELEAATRSTA